MASLRGNITNQNKRPCGGARVRLLSVGTLDPARTATANAFGYYWLPLIADGEYVLHISDPKHGIAYHAQITLKGDAVLDVQVDSW